MSGRYFFKDVIFDGDIAILTRRIDFFYSFYSNKFETYKEILIFKIEYNQFRTSCRS